MKLLLVSLFMIGFATCSQFAKLKPCLEANWVECAFEIYKLHTWKQNRVLPLNGHSCSASVKGRIHKLKWVRRRMQGMPEVF